MRDLRENWVAGMQGIRIPLRACNFVNWLDLKSELMEKMASLPGIRISFPLPFSFWKRYKISLFYCGITWCELDDIKLPVYKIDLNSSTLLLSCLSWGMKAAKLIFSQIFSSKGSFLWWRSMQLQNFSVTRHSGKWWAIKLKVTCLFRL